MSNKSLSSEQEVFPFSDEKAEREAMSGITHAIAERVTRHRDQFVSPQNVMKYRHGRSWSGPTIPYADAEGQFTKHSSMLEVKFDDILNGDLCIVESFINEAATSMSASISKMMYSKFDEATEKTGNVVQGVGKKAFPEIMIEMYNKIKLGVDREGNVSLPKIVASPSQKERIEQEMAAMDEETAQRLNEVIGARAREAVAEEQARLSKFERLNDAEQ